MPKYKLYYTGGAAGSFDEDQGLATCWPQFKDAIRTAIENFKVNWDTRWRKVTGKPPPERDWSEMKESEKISGSKMKLSAPSEWTNKKYFQRPLESEDDTAWAQEDEMNKRM